LHFTSFKGNISLGTALLANGADINATNLMGINVMHAAAQGDQPISLYFFKMKGAEMKARDNAGNTPLHWTCYMTAEVAMVYLLSWYKFVDDADHDGKTPLHMAIK
jgi:ankyrin repeat protein